MLAMLWAGFIRRLTGESRFRHTLLSLWNHNVRDRVGWYGYRKCAPQVIDGAFRNLSS
jgi:hypothetical protein